MLKIGDSASLYKKISESDVYQYADISGDTNPLHISREYAKDTLFENRIVHGMLLGGVISAVIGTKMPGEGTIYLEQNLKFLHPIYIDDTVQAIVEVDEIINEDKGIIRLHTYETNQMDEIVVDGYAVVKI